MSEEPASVRFQAEDFASQRHLFVRALPNAGMALERAMEHASKAHDFNGALANVYAHEALCWAVLAAAEHTALVLIPRTTSRDQR